MVWKHKTLHTSATYSYSGGPISEVATAVQDSVGRQNHHFFYVRKRRFPATLLRINRSPLVGHVFLFIYFCEEKSRFV